MSTEDMPPPQHYLDWSNRGKPALWRYILAIVVALFLWVFGPVPVIVLLGAAMQNMTHQGVFMQYTFLPGLIGVLLVTWVILGRPAYSVFSGTWPPRFKNYLWGVMIGWSLGIVMAVLTSPFISVSYVGWGGLLGLGIPLIAALLFGFMIQTAFEELLFRGLIMQATRRLTYWMPFVIGLQAVLFAAPHFGNVGAWTSLGAVSILPYVIVALSWGWVTWRTGSLLMSMGLHFAGNTFNVLATGTKGDILVPYAPFIQEMPSLPFVMALTTVQSLLTVLAVELIMRRRARTAAAS